MNKFFLFGGIAVVAVLISLGLSKSDLNLGSVGQSDAYKSYVPTSTETGLISIKSSSGVLGSVIIASSSVGAFTVYDASMVSTTVTTTIASFKANSAVGTYTFDLNLYSGLKVNMVAGNDSNIIFTYR
jgi:hypothetical protein